MKKLLAVVVVSVFMLVAIVSGGIAQTGGADLKVTATGYRDGTTGFYNATVKNKGPATATNVIVTGGIGSGSVTSVSVPQGSCTIDGDDFTCTIGTLALNATIVVSVSGQLPNFGYHPDPITYCGGHFTVSGDQTDPVSTNNNASVCLSIPGNGCAGPNCPPTCGPGTFWCPSLGTCRPSGSNCPTSP